MLWTRRIASPILRLRVLDDRRLPVAVVFLQLLEHRTGETEFGEGRLKLIFPLKFLCLLRGHIGFEKGLGGIDLLSKGAERQREKREDGKEKQPDFIHPKDGGG